MPRQRGSGTHSTINQAEYVFDYLRWLAGELEQRPRGVEYDILPSVAIDITRQAEAAVERAHQGPNDTLNPEAFGVSQERGQEIIEEMDRLIKKAHARKHAT